MRPAAAPLGIGIWVSAFGLSGHLIITVDALTIDAGLGNDSFDVRGIDSPPYNTADVTLLGGGGLDSAELFGVPQAEQYEILPHPLGISVWVTIGGFTGHIILGVDTRTIFGDGGADTFSDPAGVCSGCFFGAGDANGDGRVTIADFASLQNHFGQQGTFADGDFNHDGFVTIADFAILQNHFGFVYFVATPAFPHSAGGHLDQGANDALKRKELAVDRVFGDFGTDADTDSGERLCSNLAVSMDES